MLLENKTKDKIKMTIDHSVKELRDIKFSSSEKYIKDLSKGEFKSFTEYSLPSESAIKKT